MNAKQAYRKMALARAACVNHDALTEDCQKAIRNLERQCLIGEILCAMQALCLLFLAVTFGSFLMGFLCVAMVGMLGFLHDYHELHIAEYVVRCKLYSEGKIHA